MSHQTTIRFPEKSARYLQNHVDEGRADSVQDAIRRIIEEFYLTAEYLALDWSAYPHEPWRILGLAIECGNYAKIEMLETITVYGKATVPISVTVSATRWEFVDRISDRMGTRASETVRRMVVARQHLDRETMARWSCIAYLPEIQKNGGYVPPRGGHKRHWRDPERVNNRICSDDGHRTRERYRPQ